MGVVGGYEGGSRVGSRGVSRVMLSFMELNCVSWWAMGLWKAVGDCRRGIGVYGKRGGCGWDLGICGQQLGDMGL